MESIHYVTIYHVGTLTEMLHRWGNAATERETGIPGQDLLRMDRRRLGHPVYHDSYLTEAEVLRRQEARYEAS